MRVIRTPRRAHRSVRADYGTATSTNVGGAGTCNPWSVLSFCWLAKRRTASSPAGGPGSPQASGPVINAGRADIGQAAADASSAAKPVDPNPYVSHVRVFQGADFLGGPLAQTSLEGYVPATVEVKLFVADCSKGWVLVSMVLHKKDGTVIGTLDPDPQQPGGRSLCTGTGEKAGHSLYVTFNLPDPKALLPAAQVSGIFRAKYEPDRPFASNVPAVTVAVNAISLAVTSGEVLWAGTLTTGLLGLRQGPQGVEHVRYSGEWAWTGAVVKLANASSWPKSSKASGPPTSTVNRIVADGAGGLFIGSAAGGLAHFKPGADPFDQTAAAWRWWAAPPPVPSNSTDLLEKYSPVLARNTVLSILPDGPQATWVGTPTHLWHVVLPEGAEFPQWTEVVPGSAFALARSGTDTVWVGFVALDPAVAGEPPPGVLLRLHRSSAADPWQKTWFTAAQLGMQPGVIPDLDVISLYVQDPWLWIGTNAGLLGATISANGLAVGPGKSLRWKEGPDGLVDGDVLAIAPVGPNSLWLGAFDHCEQDGGALIRLDFGALPFDGAGDSLTTWTTASGLKDADVAAIVPLGPTRVAFATFNHNLGMIFNGFIGLNMKRSQAGCVASPPGKDGVTILDTAGTPTSTADDVLFDF